jgi:hypothetical protein
MARMSKSIRLALVTSSVILAGCAADTAPPLDADKDKDQDKHATGHGSGRSIHWYSHTPWGGYTSRSSPSGSIHGGGFGGTGHAVGS